MHAAIRFHTAGLSLLLLTAIIFCILIRSDDNLKKFDATTLYTYTKSTFDVSAFKDKLKTDDISKFIYKLDDAAAKDLCRNLTKIPPGADREACVLRRAQLAHYIHDSTKCNTENSQFCSCVYLFTQPLFNTSFVVANITHHDSTVSPNTETLGNSIQQCMKLRRSRDILTSFSSDHKQSQLLLMISMALFVNVLYHLLPDIMSILCIPDSFIAHISLYSTFHLVILACAIAAGASTSPVAFLEVTIITVSSLLIGLYYEIFFLKYKSPETETFLPTVHPITFGIVYGCLTNYILVYRGIVSIETLMVEIIKSTAATCIYTKIIMFYYKNDLTTSNKFIVHRAQLLAMILLMAISVDMLFTPYGDKNPFHVMWLTPLLWVLVSLSESVIIQNFDLGYSSSADPKNRGSLVDIRRNIVLTFTQLFLFLVTSHLCAQYYNFANIHRNDEGNTSPLDYRYMLKQDYALPGYLSEGIN